MKNYDTQNGSMILFKKDRLDIDDIDARMNEAVVTRKKNIHHQRINDKKRKAERRYTIFTSIVFIIGSILGVLAYYNIIDTSLLNDEEYFSYFFVSAIMGGFTLFIVSNILLRICREIVLRNKR